MFDFYTDLLPTARRCAIDGINIAIEMNPCVQSYQTLCELYDQEKKASTRFVIREFTIFHLEKCGSFSIFWQATKHKDIEVRNFAYNVLTIYYKANPSTEKLTHIRNYAPHPSTKKEAQHALTRINDNNLLLSLQAQNDGCLNEETKERIQKRINKLQFHQIFEKDELFIFNPALYLVWKKLLSFPAININQTKLTFTQFSNNSIKNELARNIFWHHYLNTCLSSLRSKDNCSLGLFIESKQL